MKRHTMRLSDGRACFVPQLSGHTNKEVCESLAAYEETGLEPEEIQAIAGLASENCAKTADAIDKLLQDDAELKSYRELGPIDRLRELAQADREGRIMLRSAGSGKKCGSCVHWHRISETKRGTCDVRQWERNRRGHMEPWRHSFTPAQSYGACRYYIPGEDSANG